LIVSVIFSFFKTLTFFQRSVFSFNLLSLLHRIHSKSLNDPLLLKDGMKLKLALKNFPDRFGKHQKNII